MTPYAEVIRRLLVQLNLIADSRTAAWASFVSFLPDTPHKSVVIYDTSGMSDGRLMQGDAIIHPGISIRVRSPDYPELWGKVRTIALSLDMVKNWWISISPTENYYIQNISRRGDILPMGIEDVGDDRRFNFTINATLTIKLVEEMVTISNPSVFVGDVDPEGVITAPPGTYYWNLVRKSQWIKETGSGNTGWYQQFGPA